MSHGATSGLRVLFPVVAGFVLFTALIPLSFFFFFFLIDFFRPCGSLFAGCAVLWSSSGFGTVV